MDHPTDKPLSWAARLAAQTKVIESSPPSAELFLARAMMHHRLENYEPAAADYRRSFELDPRNHRSRLGLARALIELDRLDEVVDMYTEIIERTPGDGHVRVARAQINETLRRFTAVVEDCDAIVDLGLSIDEEEQEIVDELREHVAAEIGASTSPAVSGRVRSLW